MRVNKKRIWLALAVAVVVVAIGGAWWSAAHQPPPQIITLPTGEQYRFAGATYGTKNIAPTVAAHIFNLLPLQFEIIARKYLKARVGNYPPIQKFDSPQLFAWFERLGTNSSPAPTLTVLGAFVANESDVEGGVQSLAVFIPGSQWSCFIFPVAPKRDRVGRCVLYAPAPSTKPIIGRVSFPNPLYGRFPQWQPESLPARKHVGDLDIRLETFVAGHSVTLSGNPNPRGDSLRHQLMLGAPATTGENSRTWFHFALRSGELTNAPWILHSSELSDATGNVLNSLATETLYDLRGRPQTQHPDGWTDYMESLPGVLWPEESAWRLKLEFKRFREFDQRDLVTFKNVPVPKPGATNALFLTNMVGGVQIVLGWPEIQQHLRPVFFLSGMPAVPLAQRNMTIGSNMLPREFLRAELPGQPAGVALDFVEMTVDGQPAAIAKVGPPTSASDAWLSLATIPANAQTADITFVVQKTRAVEFLVKPPGQ